MPLVEKGVVMGGSECIENGQAELTVIAIGHAHQTVIVLPPTTQATETAMRIAHTESRQEIHYDWLILS